MEGGSEVLAAPLPRMQERFELASRAGGRLVLVRAGTRRDGHDTLASTRGALAMDAVVEDSIWAIA
jgi:hypothetical protein